jgi:hypothetical protein
VLRVRPCTVKQALPFVARVHRRLPKVQGAMWAVGAHRGDDLIGVALVGWPARELNDDTLAVLRVAVVEGNSNACSLLYGACSRAGKAMGAENMVTYTHLEESGVSLKAAGWIDGGLTDGGEWDRPDRPRQLALDPEPKRRWWAPWSVRAIRLRDARFTPVEGSPGDRLRDQNDGAPRDGSRRDRSVSSGEAVNGRKDMTSSRHDWRCWGCWRFVPVGAAMCADCSWCPRFKSHLAVKFGRCECGWWRKHIG